MSQVLSNDQVAALVEAARGGELPDAAPATGGRRRRVRRIDFTRPSKFTSDQQRRLERAHENWCRSVSNRLAAELRLPLELQVIDMVQLTWGNALEQVPENAVSAVVEIQPLRTQMLMAAEVGFILSMIERLLGGGVNDTPRDRTLTDIDRALIGRIFGTLLDELAIACNDMGELRFELRSLEPERAPAQLAPLSEPTLALTVEVKLGRSSSTMVLLLPHRSVEPVLDAGGVEILGEEAAQTAEAVGAALGNVDVPLRAEIGSSELPLEQVLALKPGDLVPLGRPSAGGAVTLYADQTPLYRAKPGRNGVARAAQILDRLEVGR